jgi:hypothetical protein
MKTQFLTCILVFVFCAVALGSAREEWASQALSRMSDISTRPTVDDFEYLCLLAAQKGSKDETRNKVYSAAVAKLQELENIETVFRSYLEKNKLKMDQQALLPAARSRRYSAIGALGKLRHPDAVKVLGSMLSISREEEERQLKRMIEHRGDYTLMPHDALLAAQALYGLIEDPPLQKNPSNYLLSDAKPWRAWWDEVKDGDETFSFKGESVEYRFRPDGAWDTIPIANPPDDGPKPSPAATDSENQASPPTSFDSVKPNDHSLWWWIAGAGGVLVAVAFALFRKSSKTTDVQRPELFRRFAAACQTRMGKCRGVANYETQRRQLMKTTTLVILATLAPLFAADAEWTEEARRIEAQQVKLWEQTLESARQKAPHEQLNSLWLGLKNMGYRQRYEGYSVEVDRIFYKIQATMLSIPGHSRYFADEIKREQEKIKDDPTVTGPRVSYDRMRGWYFLTMRHLPSPETIAVLGDFLADDKDQPGPLDPSKSYDYDLPPANSVYSAGAIHDIGLRNPPMKEEGDAAHPDDLLAATRAWWEEVKTGKRTFSFKGQAVEYRFRPDGAWDTIPIANPPDDGPKPVPALPESGKRDDSPATVDSVKTEDHSAWWWLAGIGGTVVAVVFAWLRQSRRAGESSRPGES